MLRHCHHWHPGCQPSSRLGSAAASSVPGGKSLLAAADHLHACITRKGKAQLRVSPSVIRQARPASALPVPGGKQLQGQDLTLQGPGWGIQAVLPLETWLCNHLLNVLSHQTELGPHMCVPTAICLCPHRAWLSVKLMTPCVGVRSTPVPSGSYLDRSKEGRIPELATSPGSW